MKELVPQKRVKPPNKVLSGEEQTLKRPKLKSTTIK